MLTFRLGGALETPAAKYPRTFRKLQFFHDFPYALPGIATGVVAITAALTTTFFVKEVSVVPQMRSRNMLIPLDVARTYRQEIE